MNLDPLSLDQMRVFLAVAETGSFSAAARRVRRAQSAVSYAVATLERQLGLALFDRSSRKPVLTAVGQRLQGEIAAIVARSDQLQAEARALAGGLEPELGLVVDTLASRRRLAGWLGAFHDAFPRTAIRLDVETLGGVVAKVLDGQCVLGIATPSVSRHPDLVEYALPSLHMISVAAPFHPLAARRGLIGPETLRGHVQIVLSDRTTLTAGREWGVLSPSTWRVADLATKHALLLAGVGWGGMPDHMVIEDLAQKRLVRLRVHGLPPEGDPVPLRIVHRRTAPLGPAAQWLLARMLG